MPEPFQTLDNPPDYDSSWISKKKAFLTSMEDLWRVHIAWEISWFKTPFGYVLSIREKEIGVVLGAWAIVKRAAPDCILRCILDIVHKYEGG